MSEEAKGTSWWRTTLGAVTATATALTAVVGVVVALREAGFLKRDTGSELEQSPEAEAGSTSDAPASIGGAPAGLRLEPHKTQPVQGHGGDKPQPLAIATTYQLTLDSEEESYFSFTPLAPMKLILDMRLPNGESSNLQARAVVLDEDGVSVGDPVALNEVDAERRIVARLPVRPGRPAVLRLINGRRLADLWLTVQAQSATAFVPLFGEIVPRPLKLGQSIEGGLGTHEYDYYALPLRRGRYKLIVDFTNAEDKNTNIQGDIALLDPDGDDFRIVADFNEVDRTARKAETFTVPRDQTRILRVHNGIYSVTYRLRVVQG